MRLFMVRSVVFRNFGLKIADQRMNIQQSVTLNPTDTSPAAQGFSFPAEWLPHKATWLTWPHTEASWSRERQELMFPACIEFIKTIAQGE
jgi:agmatine deiminase